jgi:hypothetical protein
MTLQMANLKGNLFSVEYTDAFSDKLEQMKSNTIKAVIRMLEQSEEELMETPVGESFFLVGEEYSIEGVREEKKFNLVRLIPSSHIL